MFWKRKWCSLRLYNMKSCIDPCLFKKDDWIYLFCVIMDVDFFSVHEARRKRNLTSRFVYTPDSCLSFKTLHVERVSYLLHDLAERTNQINKYPAKVNNAVVTPLIVSITKFSIVIGSPRAYLSCNLRAITWVSNYRYSVWTFCNWMPTWFARQLRAL